MNCARYSNKQNERHFASNISSVGPKIGQKSYVKKKYSKFYLHLKGS